MKIIPIEQLKANMRIAQNVYRMDGLLAFQKGDLIDIHEKNELKEMGIGYIAVMEKESWYETTTFEYTLDIIKNAFIETPFLEGKFSKELFNEIEKYLNKNKKIQKYLIELKEKESYFFVQSINSAIILSHILNKDGLKMEKLAYVIYLVLLHDIGVIETPITYNGYGQLSEEEFVAYKSHPETSYKLLRDAGLDPYDMKFITEHHENINGTGFPNRLVGKDITNIAQLLHIANFYNDHVQIGPDKKAIYPCEAIDEIIIQKGQKFDSDIVEYFLQQFEPYKINQKVELTDGSMGIVKQYGRNIFRPVVEIIHNEKGITGKIINLNRQRNIKIHHVIFE